MGHRLSKIYTRTGDTGTTGLGNGKRVDKSSLRVEAMGTVDELNSAIGIILAHDVASSIHICLTSIQHDLFDLGGELCIPGRDMIDEKHIVYLEKALDDLNADLPYLKEFILPGGNIFSSFTHLARSICRRAERVMVRLAKTETVGAHALAYINRLSDLLFVVARVLSHMDTDAKETSWKNNNSRTTNT